MIGAYSPYGPNEGGKRGVETGSVQAPKQVPSDPRKVRTRQLTWKFFSSSSNAYQLDAILRPIPASASHLLKEQGAGHIAEVLINGVRVFAAPTPPTLRKAAEHAFQVAAKDLLPELHNSTIFLRLEEDSKQGKLGGIARLGKRTFATPEFSAGEGIEPLRRLTWRVVYANWCYYISYTVLQRFAVSQIAINGFVVCIRKHSVFQQLPFKKAKYDVDINEPGLGEIYGQRLTLRAELAKDDVIEAVAKIGEQSLPPARYFRGDAHRVLPLLQAEPAREMRLEEILGDAPRGWVPPQTALNLQKAGYYSQLAPGTPPAKAPAPVSQPPPLPGPSSSSSPQPAPSRRAAQSSPPASVASTSPLHTAKPTSARSQAAIAPEVMVLPPPMPAPVSRFLPGGLESVPEAMESQNSLGEPLSAAASAELLGQASQRTMNLEDTQVVAALANLDSFGTSSEELVSEGSGELSRQKSAEARRRRKQAAAELSKKRSTSDELLAAVEADSHPSPFSLSAHAATDGHINGGSLRGQTADTREVLRQASAELQKQSSLENADKRFLLQLEQQQASDALVRALRGTGSERADSSQLLSTPPQAAREAPRSSKPDRSGRSEDSLPGPAKAAQAGWLPATWSDGSSGRPASVFAEGSGGADTPDARRVSYDSSMMDGPELTLPQSEEGTMHDGNATSDSTFSPAQSFSEAAAEGPSPQQALEAASAAEPAQWCLDKSDIQIARTANGKKMRIGEGSTGTVYKALMHGCDEVAVKLVKAATPTEKDRDAFFKEVLMLHALRHRNIVQFYGAVLEPDSFFIVTELMTGGDMYTALRRCPELMAWNRMGRRIAIDVALGLNHLHSRRPAWAHRDLKSPNVLLTREGVAKIGDVGLMRPQVAASLTAQNAWTPLWAAPEVIRHERATIKADVWSYGIIIWELVSQQNIADFPSLGMSCQMRSQGGQALKLPKMCPPNAARVFYECTKVQPSERPDVLSVVEWLRDDD